MRVRLTSLAERCSWHPIRVLATGVGLTLLLFILLGWTLWNERRQELAAARDSRVQTLSAIILHLDEVLTMTARMAAVTGNVRWEDRYREFEPKLEATIEEVSNLEAGALLVELGVDGIAQTHGANANLVALEKQAFGLVRQGQGGEAEALLFSKEYEEQKRIYANGVHETLGAVERRVQKESTLHKRRVFLVALTALVILVTLLATWVAVLALLRWHLMKRKRTQKELRQAYDELELRVQDRTAHLAAANRGLEQEIVERKRIAAQLAKKGEQLELLARHQMQIEEELRRRISRELHDELGQSLTALLLDVQRRVRRDASQTEWVHVLDELQRMIRLVREISYGLRPPELEAVGLAKSLESLGAAADRMNGAAVDVDARLRGRLPAAKELCLYRVAQEALRNAVEHGHATRVKVSVQEEGGWTVLTISDNGEGFDKTGGGMRQPATYRGLGLVGMQERVAELGGTLAVHSAVGRGTRISARLPAPAEDLRPGLA